MLFSHVVQQHLWLKCEDNVDIGFAGLGIGYWRAGQARDLAHALGDKFCVGLRQTGYDGTDAILPARHLAANPGGRRICLDEVVQLFFRRQLLCVDGDAFRRDSLALSSGQ